MTSDLQAIIFAGGKGSRMTQLLHGKAKCLLPIGNKPMIQYPLELLIRSGIKDTIIVVLDQEEETIKSTIHRLNLDINVDYVSISSINDTATGDSLRLVKKAKKIQKDILVLSCDIVTDLTLNNLIQLYREKNPTFACLLTNIGSEKEHLIPAQKLKLNNREFDIVGRDLADQHDDNQSRLVYFEPDIMFGDTIPIKKRILKHCPRIKLQTNLEDAHVYIFKNWILNYIDHKINIKSIKADLVPSLVRKQFRTPIIINKSGNIGVGGGGGGGNHHPRSQSISGGGGGMVRHTSITSSGNTGSNSDSDDDDIIDGNVGVDHCDGGGVGNDGKSGKVGGSGGDGDGNSSSDDRHHSSEQHLFDFIRQSEMDKLLEQLNFAGAPINRDYPQSLVSCYALVVDGTAAPPSSTTVPAEHGPTTPTSAISSSLSSSSSTNIEPPHYCIRVNNWLRFCEANRVILKQMARGSKPARSETIKSHIDGLVSPVGTTIGERCTIKRTIIGANCKISDRVKLQNCILLDNVTIEDGAVAQGALICYDVSIGNKTEIKECIVGPGQKLLPLATYQNESLTEEMLDL